MPDSGNMPEPDAQEPADLLQLALPISQKVVLVIDLVESVRLMAADEAGTVARWHDFAQTAQNHSIPAHHGRLVKSLGDGLMVEFENPRDAANAAHTLHAVMQKGNAGQSADRHMHLRAGINATHVYTDNNDIYGAGVNLAARIATLAGPGETVVTAQVRDGLTDGLDATVEDLGECYLKHIDEPVRAYRIGAAGQAPVVVAQREYATPLQPTIAVIPFALRSKQPEFYAVGDLIADGIIATLGQSGHFRVLSRLSTQALRGALENLGSVHRMVHAHYTLSGGYLCLAGKVHLSWELADAKTGTVVTADRVTVDEMELLTIGGDFFRGFCQTVQTAVIQAEVRHANRQPMTSLHSYSLLLSGVSLMHQNGSQMPQRSFDVLNHLIERHPALAQPKAWLAKWYVLRSVSGTVSDQAKEAKLALALTQRAIDLDPNDSMSHAMQGYVYNHLLGQPAQAKGRLADALSLNPNDSLAWLYQSVVQAMWGNSSDAVSSAAKALSLSPVDPLLYFYLSLQASALLVDGQYAAATDIAHHSLRLNRLHTPTYRVLLTAQMLAGHEADAQQTLSKLLGIDTHFTLANYEKSGNLESKTKQQTIQALEALKAFSLT
jgi:class 3 adenylate cyclase/tetratricopeptide (TPR) repeat protein